MQNGIVLYPELIKVTVALDNGEKTGAETSGYLMSHRQRDYAGGTGCPRTGPERVESPP
jgi:hypothetical protein